MARAMSFRIDIAVMVIVLVAPYLAYVQVHGGLWSYLVTALEQNQSEAGYVWPNPFAEGDAWDAQLLHVSTSCR